jgi:phenylacetate-CoA ligase
MIPWLRRPNNNHRDSLFNLPLYPPAPKKNGGVDLASQQLTADVNQILTSFSVVKARRQLSETSEEEWKKRGETRALALFHAAAEYVPAYKDFLQKNQIKPDKIKTIADFKQIPLVDKENYLRVYPLDQLCWHGNISSSQMISVSSGSSGQPFFWPRGQILDAETALEHELFLTSFFELDQKSTLFIVCFAMGMYVAGPVTMNSVLHMSEKGYPVTVVTPGYSPDDVLRIIPNIASQYDQVVLAGYPPYIKEIIDQGADRGINWPDINLKFLLAGEGFNESWRTYVAKLSGDRSPVHDFMNLYGSADAAVLAHETTASIVIRRRISEDLETRRKIFNDERLPSLLQYHPEHKYFETVGEEIIFTATGGVPLVRYNIHDRGGILSRSDIEEKIPELKESFAEIAKNHQLWNLPFVYVFGKSDQTAIVYGANVYPENIKKALEEEGLCRYCSGKIIMYTELDKNNDQRLHIEVECSNGTNPSKQMTEKMKRRVFETLMEVNSEYRVVNQGIGDRSVPIISLYPHGDARFQSYGAKHKWTKKSD